MKWQVTVKCCGSISGDVTWEAEHLAGHWSVSGKDFHARVKRDHWSLFSALQNWIEIGQCHKPGLFLGAI